MSNSNSRRGFLKSGLLFLAYCAGKGIIPHILYGQDKFLDKLKKKTDEIRKGIEEKVKEVENNLEKKVKEGSDKTKESIKDKSQEITKKGKNYYWEHKDEINYKVEYELKQLVENPYEYEGRVRNLANEKAIEAISNITIENKGRRVTLGEIANEKSIRGNSPIDLGVNLTLMTITGDPNYFLENIKVIKTADGYASVNDAIRKNYRVKKLIEIKDNYLRMQSSFENNDPSFDSEAIHFAASLNTINIQDETTTEKVERIITIYGEKVKIFLDNYFK